MTERETSGLGPTVRWLDVVVEFIDDFAAAVVMLQLCGNAAHEAHHQELFAAAREELSRMAQLELGRELWEKQLDTEFWRVNRHMRALSNGTGETSQRLS